MAVLFRIKQKITIPLLTPYGIGVVTVGLSDPVHNEMTASESEVSQPVMT